MLFMNKIGAVDKCPEGNQIKIARYIIKMGGVEIGGGWIILKEINESAVFEKVSKRIMYLQKAVTSILFI